MTSKTTVCDDVLIAMLSQMPTEQFVNIIVRARMFDFTLPIYAVSGMIDLAATISMILSPSERATMIERFRIAADHVEHDMLQAKKKT